ncbi:glycosyltransferase family 4 protein [Paucibacter sp. AS339]|uniref:glycosyltransferase family 4 protein n=1 Tax=Paucibacter hankyongi TaxID=3133434 RepID=UPI0030B5AA66
MQSVSEIKRRPAEPQLQRRRIMVATWFYDEQPGFLDFKYRIQALAEQYAVTLVLRAEHFKSEFQNMGLDFEVLHRPSTDKRPLLSYCWELARLARQQQPDQLLLLGSQLALAAALLPKRLPCLLYWNEHPTHFFGHRSGSSLKAIVSRALVWASYWSARRAQLLMPIGEAHRDDLLAHGVSPERVQLVYMGVAGDFARPMGEETLSSAPLRVVYTGSVAKDRGRDVMLEGLALAVARGHAFQLSIVGCSAQALDYCRERVLALGIQDHVHLHGRVPGEKIPEFLAQADVGVCLWEDRFWWRFNPPTKLFEYLVAGLPVLVSDIRTHTDYVRSGHNGLVFDYSAEGFADVLVRLQAQRADIPGWSRHAIDSAQRFRWDVIKPVFLGAVAAHLLPARTQS